ncbi:MAG: 23S rRNA (adenine(2503)-C(2))-methyltransferase RlmN [Armatimonadota bacterium]|nr:MAG: 23S rRNA (adenine(2503)-C(2))-methyltransferase RlmN [Armatimonadota bacterium]
MGAYLPAGIAMKAPATKADLLGLLPDELVLFLRGLGQPRYRAGQLFSWLHRGAAFDEMTDLPKLLRSRLAELASAGTLRAEAQETAPDGAAKLALRATDEHLVETVLLPHGRRTTVCVSSQIGCAYQCRFCATGRQGLVRSLTAGEIVEQVVRVQQACHPTRVTNVVFMGMGEPLANYHAVVKAVRLLNHSGGLHIGARHIAVSTCGLPDGIRRLASEGLQVALAISLHAATDDVRSQLVPANRKHPIAEVVSAARAYAERTGRKIAFQYVVVPGLNDTPDQARRLAALTHGLPCIVNLIPCNPLSNSEPTDPRSAGRFAHLLRARGIAVAIRRSRGAEVLGACGQLRSRLIGQKDAGRAEARPAKAR